MLKKIFNGVEYKIETIEDYLTYMEIKNMAGYKRKEVKKVKKEIDLKKIPYFEVKVVKVKGKKKEIRSVKCSICGNTYAPCTCATVTKHKGNWVNGENLDKIKFPVPCSWNIPLDKDINYGLLIKITNDLYTLYNINKQHSYSLVVGIDNRLKDLIKRWNIHILKGKIIIFEKEEK